MLHYWNFKREDEHLKNKIIDLFMKWYTLLYNTVLGLIFATILLLFTIIY